MSSYSKWTVGELKEYLKNIDDDANVVILTDEGKCEIFSIHHDEKSLVIEG